MLTETVDERTELREYRSTQVRTTLRKAAHRAFLETSRSKSEMNRRTFITTTLAAGIGATLPAEGKKPARILLRSSWQTVNIGDIVHTPGMLALLEQHSPIMGIAAGVPSVLVRQPTDTRKGRMWYDLNLNDWVFEIDETRGAHIAERLVQIGRDLPAARAAAAKARAYSRERMAAMIAAIPLTD